MPWPAITASIACSSSRKLKASLPIAAGVSGLRARAACSQNGHVGGDGSHGCQYMWINVCRARSPAQRTGAATSSVGLHTGQNVSRNSSRELNAAGGQRSAAEFLELQDLVTNGSRRHAEFVCCRLEA